MNKTDPMNNVSKLTCQWTPTSGLIPTINTRYLWKQTIVSRLSCLALAILSIPMVVENVAMVPTKVVVLVAKGIVYTVTIGKITLDKNKRASVSQIGGHLVKAVAYLVGITAFLGFFAPRFATWSHNKLGLVYAQDLERNNKKENDLGGKGPSSIGPNANSANPPRDQLSIEVERNISLAQDNARLNARISTAEAELKNARHEVDVQKTRLVAELNTIEVMKKRIGVLEAQLASVTEEKRTVGREIIQANEVIQKLRDIALENGKLTIRSKEMDTLIHEANNARRQVEEKLEKANADNEALQKILSRVRRRNKELAHEVDSLKKPKEAPSAPAVSPASAVAVSPTEREIAVSVSSSSAQIPPAVTAIPIPTVELAPTVVANALDVSGSSATSPKSQANSSIIARALNSGKRHIRTASLTLSQVAQTATENSVDALFSLAKRVSENVQANTPGSEAERHI